MSADDSTRPDVLRGVLVSLGVVTALATTLPGCQSKTEEPESRAPVPAKVEASSAPSGALPAQEPSDADLAQLPYPPFPGSQVKRFQRQPTWARKGAYTLSVEGTAKREEVSSFYIQRVKKADPGAEAEQVTPGYVRIRSTPASATLDVTVSPDGKTVTAQIGYGMF